MSARELALRRGLQLEYLTIGWNLLEALVGIIIASVSGSVALLGFGLDSGIEVFSGAVLLWRLKSDHSMGESAERTAIRLVGASFLILSAYILYEAASAWFLREAPQRTRAGIVLAIVSVIVMPMLARAKRRVARDLGSGALQADSRQSDFCAYLSGILLIGLLLNAALRWWWADPAAALAMVPLIAREGVEGVQGKTCCES
ncbi:MAG TPA: cation transporter [Terriglobales bacterium]